VRAARAIAPAPARGGGSGGGRGSSSKQDRRQGLHPSQHNQCTLMLPLPFLT
jgi:hypothetical protein